MFLKPNVREASRDRVGGEGGYYADTDWTFLKFTIGWSNSASLQLSTEISCSFMSAQMYMFFQREHTQIQLCSNWVLQGSLIMTELYAADWVEEKYPW